MSLVPEYADSSESESESSESDGSDSKNAIEEKAQNSPAQKDKLPTPDFGGSKSAADETKSSVFKNPFTEAENAKEAALQKHVKMVESRDNTILINGKKICWNYRKGRCRFGHKCKYAHDSDVQKTENQIEIEKMSAIQNSLVCQSEQTGINVKPIPSTLVQSDGVDEEFDPLKHKRKRPGLTQGLTPGKKVMKEYMRHQKK